MDQERTAMRNTVTLVAAGLLLVAAAAHAQQTTPAPQSASAAQAAPPAQAAAPGQATPPAQTATPGAAASAPPAAQSTPSPQTNIFVPSAAQIAAPQGLVGWADFGFQFTDVSGDRHRLERYRDFRDGFLLQGFRAQRQGEGWTFDATGTHLGRRDRRVAGEFRNGSKVRASFIYDQIPLYISGDTRSLYRVESAGVLRLDDSMQAAIQGGRGTLANFIGGALPFEVTSERRIAAFDLAVSPTPEFTLNVNVKRTAREGSMPSGASFGFNNAVEIPAPIDTQTTDVNGGVEWANRRGMVRLAYTGSTFTNNIPTLIWDNPVALADSNNYSGYILGNAGSQGRMALPPSNTMHGVTAAGSAKLPANSRLNANMTFGTWRQNEPLLPVTINTSVAAAPLPRETAEGDARTTAMNYTFTSQPNRYVYLSARYRWYEFDNRTPQFHPPVDVVFDQAVHEAGESEPIGYKRQNFDTDASFTPVPFTAMRIGYSRNVDDRAHRIFERTTENVVRASVDSTAARVVTVRAIFERGQRRGSGFEEELLTSIGEQPKLRHFDVADRDRDRVTALVQLTPAKLLGLSASVSVGKDDYLNSGFGLRNNENKAYMFSADIATKSLFAAGISYTEERFEAEQGSRTASPGPQFFDETRNWFTDSADKVRTVSASLDLLQIRNRVDVSVTYDASRSRATYVYRLPANTTLAAPVQLPALRNDRQTGAADVRLRLTRRLALGLLYWYEKFEVDDFFSGESTLDRLNPAGSMYLGYLFRPYEVSSAAVRLICHW